MQWLLLFVDIFFPLLFENVPSNCQWALPSVSEKPHQNWVPAQYAGRSFFVCSVLNFLHLCITIPEPAWAISYFTLLRTEVHDFYIKVLCQLLLHQQRHPNFMANLFLCHYLWILLIVNQIQRCFFSTKCHGIFTETGGWGRKAVCNASSGGQSSSVRQSAVGNGGAEHILHMVCLTPWPFYGHLLWKMRVLLRRKDVAQHPVARSCLMKICLGTWKCIKMQAQQRLSREIRKPSLSK